NAKNVEIINKFVHNKNEWGGIAKILFQDLFRCNASKERLTSIIKACYKYIFRSVNYCHYKKYSLRHRFMSQTYLI
ncbi:hypothetical protein, partial [Staphylococcus haemolyticus]|uniref:hypothetical protein n=1 Tax=Staphylococcus haemolyticus TaxID=1283 RepID=UPI001E5EF24F